jgi:hypothetical protein
LIPLPRRRCALFAGSGRGGVDAVATQEDFVKLSETQLMILSAASQRKDCFVVLPPNLKGSAARKVVEKLVNEALLLERAAKGGMPVWRRGDDNRPFSLRITKAGLKAIAVEVPDERVAEVGVNSAAGADLTVLAARSKVPTKRQRRPVKSTVKKKRNVATKTAHKKPSGKGAGICKRDNVLSLLRRPEGASLDALVKATGWQKHSVRGFLAGTVRKKLKLPLVSEKVDNVRTYRIGKAKATKDAKAASSRAA